MKEELNMELQGSFIEKVKKKKKRFAWLPFLLLGRPRFSRFVKILVMFLESRRRTKKNTVHSFP
jgi:hypothetical protein